MDVMDSPKTDLKNIIIEARPDQDCVIISPQKNIDPLIPRDPRRFGKEFDNTSPNLKRSLNSLLDISKRATSQESTENRALTPPPAFSPAPQPATRRTSTDSRLPSYEEPEPLLNNDDRWPKNSPTRERTPSPPPENLRRRSRSRSRSSRRSLSRDVHRESRNSSRASSTTPVPVKINDRRSTKDCNLVEDEWEQMSRDARETERTFYFRRDNRGRFIGSKERALFFGIKWFIFSV